MQFVIEPLNSRHVRATFSCGVGPRDHYFRQQAGQEQRRRAAAIFVAVDRLADDAVAGFYTLSATAVQTTTLPEAVSRKLPRYPELPAILLGRLAVDRRWQGRRLATRLVADALQRCAPLDQIGALFMVVDAKKVALQPFYERLGFHSFPDQPRRLFFVLATLR